MANDKKTYETNCNNGNLDDCYRAARLYERENIKSVKALALYKKTCNGDEAGWFGVYSCFFAAEIYERKGNNMYAMKFYKKACREDDDLVNNLRGCEAMARLYKAKGNTENALRVYRNTCKKDSHFSIYSCYGVRGIHEKAGDNSKVLRFYENICNGNYHQRTVAHICNDLSVLYKRKGDNTKAKQFSDRAKALGFSASE